jgi:hypothetical protein
MKVLDPPAVDLEPFDRFCGELLTADTGRPLVLEGFQKEMLGGYFAGIRETLALLSKKNGKSSLLAALGLYELCSIPIPPGVTPPAVRAARGHFYL